MLLQIALCLLKCCLLLLLQQLLKLALLQRGEWDGVAAAEDLLLQQGCKCFLLQHPAAQLMIERI